MWMIKVIILLFDFGIIIPKILKIKRLSPSIITTILQSKYAQTQ
jgi:hypothetical protein